MQPASRRRAAHVIYIEYMSRRAGVSIETYHRVLGGIAEAWGDSFESDRLLFALGRTWRIGPEPEYVFIWQSSRSGLDQLDEWERAFESPEAAALNEPHRLVARIDAAGCYEPVLAPRAASGGPY